VLRIAGEIRDGVVRSDTLDLRTPLLRVGVKGQADVAERTVDYTANLLVTGTLAGQGGQAATELRGLEVPVRFTGAWLDPKIDVLLDEALKARAEGELERDKAEAEQRLEAEKQKARERADREEQKAKKALERKRDEAREELEQELEGLLD
jgi:AsmA protein